MSRLKFKRISSSLAYCWSVKSLNLKSKNLLIGSCLRDWRLLCRAWFTLCWRNGSIFPASVSLWHVVLRCTCRLLLLAADCFCRTSGFCCFLLFNGFSSAKTVYDNRTIMSPVIRIAHVFSVFTVCPPEKCLQLLTIDVDQINGFTQPQCWFPLKDTKLSYIQANRQFCEGC